MIRYLHKIFLFLILECFSIWMMFETYGDENIYTLLFGFFGGVCIIGFIYDIEKMKTNGK